MSHYNFLFFRPMLRVLDASYSFLLLLSFPMIGLAASGPLAPQSFQALLMATLSQDKSIPLLDVALKIAIDHQNEQIGVDAVSYIFTNCSTCTVAPIRQVREIVEKYPNTLAGARAAEEILNKTGRTEGRILASTWSVQFMKKKVGMACAIWLLDDASLSSNPNDVETRLAELLRSYELESMIDARVLTAIAGSLDIIGEPYWAGELRRNQSRRRGIIDNLDTVRAELSLSSGSGSMPSSHVNHAVLTARGMFASEFRGSMRSALMNADELLTTLDAIESDLPSGSTTPGDLVYVCQRVLDGIVERLDSSVEDIPRSSEIIAQCLLLWRKAMDSGLVSTNQFCSDALTYGKRLMRSGRPQEAQAFLAFATDRSTNAGILEEAGIALAELYVDEWQAYDRALSVLSSVTSTTDSVKALFVSARINYQLEEYDSALNDLTRYIGTQQVGTEHEKALFLMGYVLGKLNRVSERDAVWEQVKKKSKNQSILNAIETAMSANEQHSR